MYGIRVVFIRIGNKPTYQWECDCGDHGKPVRYWIAANDGMQQHIRRGCILPRSKIK